MLVKVLLLIAAFCTIASSHGNAYEVDGFGDSSLKSDPATYDVSGGAPEVAKRVVTSSAVSRRQSGGRSDGKFMCVFCTINPHICDPLRTCYPSLFNENS